MIKFNALITLFDTATRLLNATISDYLASLIFCSYVLMISNYVSNVFIVYPNISNSSVVILMNWFKLVSSTPNLSKVSCN